MATAESPSQDRMPPEENEVSEYGRLWATALGAAALGLFTMDELVVRPVIGIATTALFCVITIYWNQKARFSQIHVTILILAMSIYFMAYLTIDVFGHLRSQDPGKAEGTTGEGITKKGLKTGYLQVSILLDADADGEVDVYRRPLPDLPITISLQDGQVIAPENLTGTTNPLPLPLEEELVISSCGVARKALLTREDNTPGNALKVKLPIPQQNLDKCYGRVSEN